MSIATFINLFPTVDVDIECVNVEWQLLPDTAELETTELHEFWKIVDSLKTNDVNPMFPNLMKVVKVLLALPHSSATTERVFSQLSLIKTFLRNRLLVTTVAAIIHVKDKIKYVQNGSRDFQPHSQFQHIREGRNIIFYFGTFTNNLYFCFLYIIYQSNSN